MTTEPLHPVLVGTTTASDMLELDEDRVRDLCRSGELQSVRIASRDGIAPRKIRIPVRSIEAYVDRLVSEQCGEVADGPSA